MTTTTEPPVILDKRSSAAEPATVTPARRVVPLPPPPSLPTPHAQHFGGRTVEEIRARFDPALYAVIPGATEFTGHNDAAHSCAVVRLTSPEGVTVDWPRRAPAALLEAVAKAKAFERQTVEKQLALGPTRREAIAKAERVADAAARASVLGLTATPDGLSPQETARHWDAAEALIQGNAMDLAAKVERILPDLDSDMETAAREFDAAIGEIAERLGVSSTRGHYSDAGYAIRHRAALIRERIDSIAQDRVRGYGPTFGSVHAVLSTFNLADFVTTNTP